ncbi:MAG: NAD(P)H-binding protein [Bryobacteraceae bacterium]|nr:NAD(P)H-binding protein [Bryobacteraceae bacterium]
MITAVAGATGALGREVATSLTHQGMRVRALGRDAARLAALNLPETRVIDLRNSASLAGVCDGCNALIMASGASMKPGGWRDRAPFLSVDYLGHLALLHEAKRAGVNRIVYASLAGALKVRETEYAQAHEQFVQALATSGISHCVVRPTGFFSVFASLLPLAARGVGVVIGSGAARTNPIHEADAARACVEALESGESQMVIGGPEVFTRARLAEMAFEALGRPPRVRSVPAWLIRLACLPLGAAHPRLAGLIRFGVAASAQDLTAPAYGTLRLGDYLRERALTLRAERARA